MRLSVNRIAVAVGAIAIAFIVASCKATKLHSHEIVQSAPETQMSKESVDSKDLAFRKFDGHSPLP